MEFALSQTVVMLERTPSALDALLRELPDAWTQSREGQGTWTVFEVVAHLIHGERTDWMPRVRVILEHGCTRAFEPFDRLGHIEASRGKSLPELLDEFSSVREHSLRELHALNLQPAQLALRGLHPALGPVTLQQLLATWAVHDQTHLHQISRILAHQYREAVGPWSEYLGVLKCGGHGS
jgi:hypothetical protein